MAPCGLLFLSKESREYASVDLESTSADVVIQGFVSHLSVKLLYRNKLNESVEVSYVCPIDSKAAIYHFQAKIDNRLITAHCLEKKEAKEKYKNAVEKGHRAIYCQEDELAGDVLHLSLGNLPKGETAELELKMVMELPVCVDGSLTFTLPTVFNPRYCPADQKSGPVMQIPASGKQVFPVHTQYTLEAKGEVSGSFKIARISSASDPIQVQIADEDTHALITQDGGVTMDHDWSFQVFYQTVHKPHVLQMRGDRSGKGLMSCDILMVNFFPEMTSEGFSPHNELIFVMDRSGSMNGTRIAKAKSTLYLFLKSLPPGCRFNIISFGSSYSSLFASSSERYTEKTLSEALALHKEIDADMGGTEIYEALKHVYSKDLTPGYARQMIILTDEQVWNQNQIFDLVQRHAGETRVFVVGVGDGASTSLVEGIALAGGGRSEMVVHDNQLRNKVMGLVVSMLQETVSGLEFECELEPSQKCQLVPKIPRFVFGGQHLILYAKLSPKTEVKSLKLTWKISDKSFTTQLKEEDCKIINDSNYSIHRLAAKSQLKHWEMFQNEDMQEAMIDLSLSTGVVCKATAFVGIDMDSTVISTCEFDNFEHPLNSFMRSVNYSCANVNDVKAGASFGQGLLSSQSQSQSHIKRSIPTKKALGFLPTGGFSNMLKMAAPKSKHFSPKKCRTGTRSLKTESYKTDFMENEDYTDELKNVPESQDSFEKIVSSQDFEGSWCLEKAFDIVIEISPERIKEIQNKMQMNNECFATTLILSYLELTMVEKKQEWLLISLKGREFLKSKNVNPEETIKQCSGILAELLK